MSEDTKTNDKKHKPIDQTPPIGTVNTVSQEIVDTKSNPQNSTQNRKKRKPLSVFECWTIVLAVIGIMVAGFTGYAIYWQAQIGAKTLTEIKKGGDDTHDLARAAKAQAIAQLGGGVDLWEKKLRIRHQGGKVLALVVIQNNGQIIATNLRITGRLEFRDSRPFHDTYPSQVKVLPDLPPFAENGEVASSVVEASNEKNGGKWLYVYGTISWKILEEERGPKLFCKFASADKALNAKEDKPEGTYGYGGAGNPYTDCVQ